MPENQHKQAAISGSAIKKMLPALIGGAATSAGLDTISYHGDYSNITAPRVANALLNALLGAAGGHMIGKGGPENLAHGATVIGTAPIKDVALAAAPALQAYARNADKSFWDKMSPTQKYIVGGGTAIGVASLIPALRSINRAASRMAEGRAIRVSTSLRKRPNQLRDLNIGIENVGAPIAGSAEPAAENAEAVPVDPNYTQIPVQLPVEPPKPKGFFGRLLSW